MSKTQKSKDDLVIKNVADEGSQIAKTAKHAKSTLNSGAKTNKSSAKKSIEQQAKKIGSKKPVHNLSVQTESNINRIKNRGNKNAVPQKVVTTSRKTQGLANKIKQANIVQIAKSKNTLQNKKSSNLNHLIGDKASPKSMHVEGILKQPRKVVWPTSKNNAASVRANVIGKKTNIKVIANKGLIWAISLVTLFLVASLFFNYIVFSYFRFKEQNPNYTITKTVELEVQENDAVFASVTIPRNIVRGISLRQPVAFEAKMLENDIFVRAKLLLTSGDGVNFDMEAEYYDDWVLHEDGYAYYKKLVRSGDVVQAVKQVTMPVGLQKIFSGRNQHVATFVFETLSANRAMLAEYWKSAPQEVLELVL